ncbi:MAG: helix-turn-helix domain-containing protein [Pseudomonadota bacterium]
MGTLGMQSEDLCVIEARPVGLRRGVDRKIVRNMIELTVAAAFDLPLDELSAKTRRTAQVAFARQISMYCAHVTFGWSLTEAGSLFNRDRTTAAHACRVVEDRRDDNEVDQLVQKVEDILHQWHLTMQGCHSLRLEGLA